MLNVILAALVVLNLGLRYVLVNGLSRISYCAENVNSVFFGAMEGKLIQSQLKRFEALSRVQGIVGLSDIVN